MASAIPILIQAANLPEDPAQVLNATYAGDNKLTVVVFFRGGHPDHVFSLSAGPFAESEPKQVHLALGHDAQGDVMAKAMREEELTFDLAPLRAEYERVYGSADGAKVVLVLDEKEVPVTF